MTWVSFRVYTCLRWGIDFVDCQSLKRGEVCFYCFVLLVYTRCPWYNFWYCVHFWYIFLFSLLIKRMCNNVWMIFDVVFSVFNLLINVIVLHSKPDYQRVLLMLLIVLVARICTGKGFIHLSAAFCFHDNNCSV